MNDGDQPRISVEQKRESPAVEMAAGTMNQKVWHTMRTIVDRSGSA